MRYASGPHLVALLLLLGTPRSGDAQQVNGGLLGRTITADAAPIPAVTVTVSSPNLQGERQTVTDSRGDFLFVTLPVGFYEVRLAAIGFRPVTIEDVRIQVGVITGLPPTTMEQHLVQLEPVVVTADAFSIDPTSTEIAAQLDAKTLEVLPTDRDYQTAVTILPQANESFYGDAANIGGATGLENMYYIDGVNVTEPYNATTGTRLPYNFIESIQVKAGGYEARYGRALGAVVNAVTYTGSNEFETNVFGYFTNSTLAAEPRAGGRAELTTGKFVSYDVGFRVSGPIARDRLWFSAAYNPLARRMEKEIPGHGWYDDRWTEHRFAGKVSWRATRSTDVQLSIFGDPTTHHEVGGKAVTFLPTDQIANPDPVLVFWKTGGVNLALRGTQGLGDWGLLEFALNRSTASNVEEGDTERGRTEPVFFDLVNGALEGGYWWTTTSELRRTAATLSGTAFLGHHTVTAGAEYEDNFANHRRYSTGGGYILHTGPSSFQQYLEEPQGKVRNRIPTLFVQDSWRLTERVTLNAGIRWSTQHLVGNADTVAQTLEAEWQPRLGFAWNPGRLGSQKVFGSYGRFYQQEPLYFPLFFYIPYALVISSHSADPRLGGDPDNIADLSTTASDFLKQQGMQVDHLDEFTVGYDRLLPNDFRLSVRGVYRILRSSFGYGVDSLMNRIIGTPGEGDLSFLPSPQRTYTALQLTAERTGNHRLQFLVSYVLSRSHGNYTGLFASDGGYAVPGSPLSLQLAEQAVNSTGLLPNDRPHVFKASGSYRFPFGLSAGTFLTVQSGTPLNEFGATSLGGRPAFLVERGSAGRTPVLYDINLRITYRLRVGGTGGRVIADLLHIGNPRRTVWVDQHKFRSRDQQGNQTNENPNFGEPLAYQPPMTLRFGFDWSF